MKNKRLFIKFRDAGSRLGDYLDKKGFYIVILLCIVVIGATVAIVSIRDYEKINSDYVLEDGSISEGVKVPVSDKTLADSRLENAVKPILESASEQLEKEIVKEQNDTITKKNEDKPKEVKAATEKKVIQSKANEDSKTTNKQSKKATSTSEEPIRLSYPVYGKVINQYAMDKLIFSKTLQQWTTHSGVDISSDVGLVVKAAMDGVVKSIKNDPRYGITIIIEHKGGLKTVYSNLSSANMVKPGQTVKKGQAISGIGSTAIFESEDETHLHFEVLKDNKAVNPLDYLTSLK